MRIRALCLVAIAAVAAGCGSGKSARRHDVDAYIGRVDQVVHRYRGALAAANDAYKHFGGGATPRELARLHAAETAILAVRTDLRRVTPPKDARKLHRDLLRLVDLQLAVATGATEFEEFVPTAQRALAKVAVTNAAFRRGFSAARSAAAQLLVFNRYAADLDADADALAALAPPPALEPWQHAEVARLRRTAAAAAALGRALGSHDRATIDAAVAAFTRSTSVTTAELRAQRRAIIQYDQQVVRVARAAATVQRDRDHLQALLG